MMLLRIFDFEILAGRKPRFWIGKDNNMDAYKDCVMRKDRKTYYGGRTVTTCSGLRDAYCVYGYKCPFYGSNSEYEKDPKNGFIYKKGELK